MIRILYILVTILLLSPAGVWADEYNPANPPDPMAKFRLTVSVSPAEAGYASGSGTYQTGTSVSLSTSARQDYTFLYWMCDDVQVSDTRYFLYTMPDRHVNVVAVYGYNPINPADPTMQNKYRLNIETDIEGSCTFNIVSGAKHSAGQNINVVAQNISQGYKFQGWYIEESNVSNDLSFVYTMPYQDVTLTAHFIYNPDSPADPETDENQTNVDMVKYGDVNGDGFITMADANLVVNYYLAQDKTAIQDINLEVADVNHDGNISMADANAIVNLFLSDKP